MNELVYMLGIGLVVGTLYRISGGVARLAEAMDWIKQDMIEARDELKLHRIKMQDLDERITRYIERDGL